MTKRPTRQYVFWPGPLLPTKNRVEGQAHCQNCQAPIPRGSDFCYTCKDPEGYATRLRKAQEEARQRCLEAYPVCKHCGLRLTAEQVKAGQTSHRYGRKTDCTLTTEERAVQGREA